MPNIQIRSVPDDVHRRLKSKAALAGQSLNDFLLEQVALVASTATIEEVAERIANDPERYAGPSSAAIIREERNRR